MGLELQDVVNEYRELARIPLPVSARFSNHSSAENPVLCSSWTQRDVDRAEKITFCKTYFLSCKSEKEFDVLQRTSPQEISNELWSKESPSGSLTAVIRKIKDKKGEDKQFVEIWSGDNKHRCFNVKDITKHGDIYKPDNQFACLEWSAGEGHIVYMAEKKLPKMVSYFDKSSSEEERNSNDPPVKGEEYVVREDWGEQLVGRHRPVICVMDVDTGDVSILDNVPEHISPGQVLWTPDDTGVVFIGWDHEPYRLGVIYCPMRKSALYHIDLHSSKCERLSPEDRSARSPRFSPDGSRLLYLDTAIGGPHFQTSRLLMFDWASKEITVVIDVVYSPKDTEEFPGLYTLNLPVRCWASKNRIVIHSGWRSKEVILVVNLESKQVKKLPEGESGFSEVLDVYNDQIIAQFSSPDQPHYLAVGRLPDVGKEEEIRWKTLDADTESLGEVSWEILQLHPSPQNIHPQHTELNYEAILLKPVKSKESKIPLIVFPHGGPHTAFPPDFMFPAIFFCKCGFAVLLVNYRGSTGFGEDNLRSLLGRIGEQDVMDVQSAAEAVDKKGNINKVFIFGGSHGGFLTTHMIGQYPDFYSAAACRNPVINVCSMFNSTDIPDWNYTECGRSFDFKSLPDENAITDLWLRSPLRHVDKVKVPVLLAIGTDDRRVPPKQAYEYYKALKARNIPVKYLAYPENGHPIVKVDSEADCLVNTIQWFYNNL